MPKNFQRNCNYPMMPLIKDLATLWMAKRVEFPYRCETCGKGYQHRATLVRHTRHECGKEPQFKCPYCAHRTKQRGNLYQHIRTNHPGKNVFSNFTSTSKIREEGIGERMELLDATDAYVVNTRINFGNESAKTCTDDCVIIEDACENEDEDDDETESIECAAGGFKEDRQQYKYSCTKCLKSYKRKGHLVEHQKIFCGKDKQQCELILWEDYQIFEPTTVTEASEFRSESCSYEANYFGSDRKSTRIFRNKSTDPLGGRYKCSKCSKSYRWKHHLVEHVKASCGQKKAECCPYWRRCYTKRSSFSGRFVRSEIDIERIKLAVEAVASGLSLRKAAEKFSISKSVLHRYMECQYPVISVFKHTCTTCGKTYKHKHHLKRHHDFECGIDPKFKCAFCSHRTRYKDSLIKHILARHRLFLDQNPRYRLQQVNALADVEDTQNYSSSNWTVLTLPTMSTIPSNPVTCTRHLRSMTLKDQDKMRRYGPRKYLCTDCNRCFALMASLKRHRSFECNLLSTVMGKAEQERRRKKKHTCPNCSRSYQLCTSLWRHRNYECGVEPKFSCPICKTKTANCRMGIQKRMLQKCGIVHLSSMRQIVSNEAQSGETLAIRVRWPEAFCVQSMPGEIHAERKAKATHGVDGQEMEKHYLWEDRSIDRSILPDQKSNGKALWFIESKPDDQMYLKCLPLIDVQNNADPFSPGVSPGYQNLLFEEIGYRNSQQWMPETDKPFMCSNCGKGYTHVFTLNRHRRTVCVKGLLFCDRLPRAIWRRCRDDLLCLKCAKKYSDWRSLRKHMNFFCQMEPLYPCPYCSYRARIPTLLKYHVRREHVVFASYVYIYMYIYIYTEYIYIFCKRADLSSQQLDDSLMPDQSGKPVFVCPKCSKNVWNVQGYMTNYGPVDGLQLPPEFDKFKISAAQSLLNHHKRHMCGFCKKVFPLKNLLRRHVQFGCKMNPRNSQFACSFCPYKSTYKANMERHVRNVHDTGVLKFRCDLCNFRSNYSFCVRRHMKTFHRTVDSNETRKYLQSFIHVVPAARRSSGRKAWCGTSEKSVEGSSISVLSVFA
ncbi:Zinc finger protein Xfin [Melipona quadrifasciata]|uniref:Zinc finger protein Xfin n=1 Tax=Melipona quadrifasciata TaxID=166423 RepID=A0A0M9A099_9HYME|nr:Zinc finger protein Xfin [Melipona quadrifasciata]